MMKKVLVTGGAGFIGSHLVKRLVEKGIEVVVLDKLLRGNKLDSDVMHQVELIVGDVRDANTVNRAVKGCDHVFHFAAVLGVDIVADNPVETMDTEVLGTRNVANAAMKYGINKIIYASTSGVYGHSAIERSVTEDIVIDPRTSYAIAKRYNEIYLKALYEEKGLNSVSLRFFNIYGKKQDNRMVIPRFIEQALAGEPLTVYGQGKQTRDFTYIEDTITSCLLLAEKAGNAEVFNIANESELTIEELARTIIRITNSKSTIHYIDVPKKRYDYEVERRRGNCDKLFRITGYKPNTKLEDGLKEILNN